MTHTSGCGQHRSPSTLPTFVPLLSLETHLIPTTQRCLTPCSAALLLSLSAMLFSRPLILILALSLLQVSSLAQASTARAPLKASFLRQPSSSSPATTVHWLPTDVSDPPAWDTSSFFGSAYTPSPAGNQLWWYEYDKYEPLVKAELQAASTLFGFTALRTFIHSMVHANDSKRFIVNIDRYLNVAHSLGMKAGIVFFDDCWSDEGATLPDSCVPVKGRHNGCWKVTHN